MALKIPCLMTDNPEKYPDNSLESWSSFLDFFNFRDSNSAFFLVFPSKRFLLFSFLSSTFGMREFFFFLVETKDGDEEEYLS